jgi:hypothetical protein
MQLLNWIKSLFMGKSYQDSLEHFVASKRPTTTTEVEYWIQYYEHHKSEWAL